MDGRILRGYKVKLLALLIMYKYKSSSYIASIKYVRKRKQELQFKQENSLKNLKIKNWRSEQTLSFLLLY